MDCERITLKYNDVWETSRKTVSESFTFNVDREMDPEGKDFWIDFYIWVCTLIA